MGFEIEFKKSVHKDTKRLPRAVLILIKKRIKGLSINPFPANVKSLRGYPGFYRIRISDYRVLYSVDASTQTIIVYKISHRKEVYQGL